MTALSGAAVVVLLLTQRSVRRPWVTFEAGGAWLTNKTIIPVCAGNLKVGALPKPYSTLQALELPTQGHYLLTSLEHHLKLGAQLPTPPNATVLYDLLVGKSEELMRAERIGDPYWMLVLGNPPSNAIKFTPANGKVVLRVQQAGDEVRFAVTDTGVGIPADHLGVVFDRLTTAAVAPHRHG